VIVDLRRSAKTEGSSAAEYVTPKRQARQEAKGQSPTGRRGAGAGQVRCRRPRRAALRRNRRPGGQQQGEVERRTQACRLSGQSTARSEVLSFRKGLIELINHCSKNTCKQQNSRLVP
jgi:hypothetical protein